MVSAMIRQIRLSAASLRRLLWLVMGLLHLPALWGAGQALLAGGFDLERVIGCVVLVVTTAFFALKVIDVPCLRFRVDRHSLVVLLAVAALLHLDVVRPADNPTLIPECTTLVATTWLVGGVLSVRRRLCEFLSRAEASLKCQSSKAPTADTVWTDAFRPHCWILALRLFGLRAPPV